MIEFMSSWAEQIVLAVIVATIIELILPKNKNKKYIQMVIGIYVLFNIISPIYLDELEEIVISKFQENGFEVAKCKIDAILDTSKRNAGIHLITVKIKNIVDKSELNKIIKELAEELEIEEEQIKTS